MKIKNIIFINLKVPKIFYIIGQTVRPTNKHSHTMYFQILEYKKLNFEKKKKEITYNVLNRKVLYILRTKSMAYFMIKTYDLNLPRFFFLSLRLRGCTSPDILAKGTLKLYAKTDLRNLGFVSKYFKSVLIMMLKTGYF